MFSKPDKVLVVATRNQGKIKEFSELLGERGIEVRSLLDYADSDVPKIIENGRTFAENALIKAKTIALHLGLPVLADDSGLCVDALNGEPGVYSARYAGENATDQMNNSKLLTQLNLWLDKQRSSLPTGDLAEASELEASVGRDGKGVALLSPARFICALILYSPHPEQTIHVEGICEGFIRAERAGDAGFGYDPLFYLPSLDRTMAQLSMAEKNAVSHRGAALRMLLQHLD